ncbi:hydrogenase maturation nickel metallochaperone HypA [Nocardioides sp. GY 10127]|uniref:hydrogenase maturation nickel metallochaperone HypA/HybF n=1 Tax=Nocardioides sp. GY 10127 TaxID=2569762 RepID=UPI0010A796D6|nr:hydrogenase maturation nickel metallochaperone HypA [Nocardioides sp. GY 10127]TIC80205.1 hydrogenase maturation nickel metallochaperone HypA [Nocardioides sp. GY 10127]
MHELGLLASVVTAVEDALTDRPGTVSAVGLTVGTMSGAEPVALDAAWPMASAGTRLAGARLVVETVQAAVACPTCARDVEVDELYAWRCPVCDTPAGAISRGKELSVAWVDVEETAEETAAGPTDDPTDG